MGDPRVAVVTGAAGGIGLATVKELCIRGYVVVAIDTSQWFERAGRSETHGGALAVLKELADRFPGQIWAHDLDVTDRGGLREICEQAAVEYGHVDVCVAAAAIVEGGNALWEMSPDQFRDLCSVNITGVWNAMSAVVPLMLRNESPHHCRFVAIASAAAHEGHFGLAAYGATKHAVVGLVEGLAADLVGTGVTASPCRLEPHVPRCWSEPPLYTAWRALRNFVGPIIYDASWNRRNWRRQWPSAARLKGEF